jgi:hypothetical protein
LTWLSKMARAQKEQYMIQLYQEDKNFKAIAKLTHMSLRDISAIERIFETINSTSSHLK